MKPKKKIAKPIPEPEPSPQSAPEPTTTYRLTSCANRDGPQKELSTHDTYEEALIALKTKRKKARGSKEKLTLRVYDDAGTLLATRHP